jgi:hypothetical protein
VVSEKKINKGQREAYTTAACHTVKVEQVYMYIKGTGYEYDGNKERPKGVKKGVGCFKSSSLQPLG